MNKIDINNNTESEIIEFKKSVGEHREIGKSICAFLNNKGGNIYINVEDNGTMVKNSISESSIRKIKDLFTSFQPQISTLVEVSIENIKGFDVINVKVKEGINKVYSYDGRSYYRNGSEDKKLNNSEITNLQNKISKYDWSGEFIKGTSLESLDEDALSFLKEKLAEVNNNKKYLSFNSEELLLKLGLCDSNINVNRTALLFLGKYDEVIKYLHPDICQISWKYKDEINNIEERTPAPLTTPFLLSLYKIEDFINRFNTTIKDIDLFRSDIRQYDRDAIEELLINSLAHRDWTINLWNEIIQTPKSLEIRNPGEFYSDLESVLLKNISNDYRNTAMCDFLKRVKLMEREREGLQKVFKTQLSKGLRVTHNFDPKRTDFILNGYIEEIDFARLVSKFKSFNLSQLIVLDKISIGKNLLGSDIKEEEFLSIKDFVYKHHKSRQLKIDSELLININKFDEKFLDSYTESKTKEIVFLDFAKKNGSISTKNAYKLFPKENKNTIRGILKSLKDKDKLTSIKISEYKIPDNNLLPTVINKQQQKTKLNH